MSTIDATNQLTPGILASGGRDNQILLWDIRFENKSTNQGWPKVLPIQKISMPKKKKFLATVTSVVWLRNGGGKVLASSSSTESIIRIWDLRDTRGVMFTVDPIANIHRDYGIGCLKVNALGDRMYAAGMNDTIYEIDTLEMDCIKSYSHPDFDNSSFYIKMDVSSCGNYVASGSRSGDGFVWRTHTKSHSKGQLLSQLQQFELTGHSLHSNLILEPQVLKNQSQDTLILKGHGAELSSLSFSKTDNELVTCSDDHSIRVWREMDEEEEENHTGVVGIVEVARKDMVYLEEENLDPGNSILLDVDTILQSEQINAIQQQANITPASTSESFAEPVRPVLLPTFRQSPQTTLTPARSAPSSSRRTPSRSKKGGLSSTPSSTPSSSKSQTTIMSFFNKKQ